MSPPVTTLAAPPRFTRPIERRDETPRTIRSRFTVDGDMALEDHLADTCRRIGYGLHGLLPGAKLEGVLLGGGYGRGEGGVWRSPEGDRPYNDLEFYVFLRGNRHVNEARFGRSLHVFGEILTPQAGVDVEFRIASRDELAGAGVSMFTYDLVAGHRWLIGDDHLLGGCDHHRNAEDIPAHEATRLLMNRASGLLFAQERLARPTFSPADADFVGRNIAKAQLGMGDAVLTLFHEYHWSAGERHRRLERRVRTEGLGWLADVCQHHAAGLDFKLHPTRNGDSRQQLAQKHQEVSDVCRGVWLWAENRRLSAQFRTVREYALSNDGKCPEAAVLRNVLVNAKVLGPAAAMHPLALRHPRERVLNALPLLLWQHDALKTPAVLARIHQQLRTGASDLAGIVAAYRRIWERVN